ncbi:hypothetical protein Ancab_008680, partial [Ancistrocladus abbreviatus]
MADQQLEREASGTRAVKLAEQAWIVQDFEKSNDSLHALSRLMNPMDLGPKVGDFFIEEGRVEGGNEPSGKKAVDPDGLAPFSHGPEAPYWALQQGNNTSGPSSPSLLVISDSCRRPEIVMDLVRLDTAQPHHITTLKEATRERLSKTRTGTSNGTERKLTHNRKAKKKNM